MYSREIFRCFCFHHRSVCAHIPQRIVLCAGLVLMAVVCVHCMHMLVRCAHELARSVLRIRIPRYVLCESGTSDFWECRSGYGSWLNATFIKKKLVLTDF